MNNGNNKEFNGYELSRQWFDFCFENPEKINPKHTAIYFFAIEHCNRLGWKKKFGFPTQMAMDAIGIKSYNTYIKAFRDIIDWGFFDLIEKSQNQYSSNIIALSKINGSPDKSLDKAFRKHSSKHQRSTLNNTDSINKQRNKGTKEPGNSAGVCENDLSIPEKIDQSKSIKELSLVWFGYLEEKKKWPTLSEQEMIQHDMKGWGLDKAKKMVKLSVRNGWKSLDEKYMDPEEEQRQDNPHYGVAGAAAYRNDYTNV